VACSAPAAAAVGRAANMARDFLRMLRRGAVVLPVAFTVPSRRLRLEHFYALRPRKAGCRLCEGRGCLSRSYRIRRLMCGGKKRGEGGGEPPCVLAFTLRGSVGA
jgi:hypothetical protein